eukprot:5698665-Prymnesium_polylepis.1
MRCGALASCRRLHLDANRIGDWGLQALAGALSVRWAAVRPRLACCQQLFLNGNEIGDEGASALGRALSAGAMANV